MNSMEIGKRLRGLRHSKGCDIATVCGTVGISTSALSMYECGLRIPRDEIKIKLASFYGVTVDFLFFSSDDSRNVSKAGAS